MNCPSCNNDGFQPSEEIKNPLHNMGKKRKYNTFDERRYVCLQCGFAFTTEEKFGREVEVKSNQQDLFKNAS